MSGFSSSTTRVQTHVPKKKAARGTFLPKVNLSVQDRRQKTRLLNETQRRKDQLLGLTTYDVAAHLYRYTFEPCTMMDESRKGCAMPVSKQQTQPSADGSCSTGNTKGDGLTSSTSQVEKERDPNMRWHTQYTQHLQHKNGTAEHGQASPSTAATARLEGGDKDGDDEDGEPLPLRPRSYDEWMAAGCPTGSWAVLLHEEVYASVAAEKALLAAKYDPKGQMPSSTA